MWFSLGNFIKKNNKIIANQHTFVVSEERKEFAKQCLPIYEKYYPEILDEIKGIADGQQTSYEDMLTFLLSMYCFEFNNKCTCIAISDKNQIILGRNSDFLVELEKLYMNCLYNLDNCYSFNGNTTAFVEMEDDAAAAKAIAELDGAEFFGRQMVVKEALPRTKELLADNKAKSIPLSGYALFLH